MNLGGLNLKLTFQKMHWNIYTKEMNLLNIMI